MKIIRTDDGSNTIFLEDLNETYHSRYGALQESNHVFIKNGFRYLISDPTDRSIRIFELGLGTGLNAVLTALESRKLRIPVEYTSIEPNPVPEGIVEQLDYARVLRHPSGKFILREIHNADWEVFTTLHPHFRFRKINTTIQDLGNGIKGFDLVYYDAFAPNRQPELWHIDILGKIYDLMDEKAVFVTYCAKGQVKRDLRDIGFTVQTVQGPPGKKEMIRGIKH
jgi:tRNA U34 5-methylaminomethyl-2-thiouridine-forming methyltransferase MnmC